MSSGLKEFLAAWIGTLTRELSPGSPRSPLHEIRLQRRAWQMRAHQMDVFHTIIRYLRYVDFLMSQYAAYAAAMRAAV
jgi:hypothetical protein